MAGNQQGKTYSGAAQAAFHLTGLYPQDYKGIRFSKPVTGWVGGVTSEVTRDTVQKLLFGSHGNYGSGLLPLETIPEDGVVNARGIPGAIDKATVRHVSGGLSIVKFKNYEQGREKWQGETLDFVWLDEEPPEELYTEALTRTNATNGIVWMTFTPLLGMSAVVRRFIDEPSKDRAVVNMTIDDALHIDKEMRDRIVASYPAHERDARLKGIPMLGSGAIFPVAEENIKCAPFKIPFTYQFLGGLDFGWDHPTAAVKIAYDPDSDIVYITHVYRKKEAIPLMHSAALKPWGEDLYFAWPHDGLQHDKGSGEQLADQYRKCGLKLLSDRAKFSDGSNGVEAGLMLMLDRMQTGRFKVFDTCTEFFDEFRRYHRKEGQVVKEFDDIMCAARYAIMCLRFAKFKNMDDIRDEVNAKYGNKSTGHSVKMDYNPLDIDYINKDYYDPFKN